VEQAAGREETAPAGLDHATDPGEEEGARRRPQRREERADDLTKG
jgi:hypothetical protein